MLPCLLGLALVAGSTWTVDDDGHAHFPTITAAVLAASSGDTILVAPGIYGPFSVNGKSLTIAAADPTHRPRVTGISVLDDAAPARLAHLQLQCLYVTDTDGPVHVDDCQVGTWTSGLFEGLNFANVDGVLVSRCQVRGWSSADSSDGGPGVRVQNGRVTFVGCSLVGGSGYDQHSDGGPGLSVTGPNSRVEIAAGGASGGMEGIIQTFGSSAANSGDGIVVEGGRVVVRGDSSDGLAPGPTWFAPNQLDGFAINASFGAEVVVSGVDIVAPAGHAVKADATSTVTILATPEPFLEFTGSPLPGALATLRIHGPAGMPALLLRSLSAQPMPLGGWEGALWPSAFVIDPLVTLGHDTPLVLSGTVPTSAALQGQSVWFQAAFPRVPGTFDPALHFLSNPDALLIGP